MQAQHIPPQVQYDPMQAQNAPQQAHSHHACVQGGQRSVSAAHFQEAHGPSPGHGPGVGAPALGNGQPQEQKLFHL